MSLHKWFSRNNGKGWVDCKASRPNKLVACGRESASGGGKGRKYPACRPTYSQCNSNKRKKTGHKRISWGVKK